MAAPVALLSVKHGKHRPADEPRPGDVLSPAAGAVAYDPLSEAEVTALVPRATVGLHEFDKAIPPDRTQTLLQRHGIRIPVICYVQARRVGLPVALGAAILMRETAGGTNEFGHDPTVAVGWGLVTPAKYRAYVKLRDQRGHGSRCQGVGGTQLTYVGFQDAADRLGGCHLPAYNVLVGFSTLAHNVRRAGLYPGVRAYNGSGPAATAYANAVIAGYRWWTHILGGATLTEIARLDLTATPEREALTLPELAAHHKRVGDPRR